MASVKKEGTFKLTQTIMANSTKGDAGKLDGFFGKVVKQLTREISNLKTNSGIITNTSKQSKIDLEDQLEDAREGLKDAFLSVNVEKIGTNEAQKALVIPYMQGIISAKATISLIEQTIKDLAEETALEIGNVDSEIKVREEAIEMISQN